MNIIKYLQDKKDELDSEVHLALQQGTDNINYLAGQMGIVDEVLLYARLNDLKGIVRFKISDEWNYETQISTIESAGGTIIDVQISAASEGVSVSAGDRAVSMQERSIVTAKVLIKYIEGPDGS